MSPRGTQPFDRAPVLGITGDGLQAIDDIFEAHGAQPVQKSAGIIQHHARILAFVNQLGKEFAHAFVAPVKDRGIVVIADAGVVHHVFQVADHRGGSQIGTARGNQRLVHVERATKSAADAAKVDSAFI